jgi:hypothetical protein
MEDALLSRDIPTMPGASEPHAIGGSTHNADTFTNFKLKITEAVPESETGAQDKADAAEDAAIAASEPSGIVATHTALPDAHHAAFTQTNHDALPNPHHSNSLDHSNALDHSNSLDHSNANDPTAGEKAALVGTSGTPGSGNKYVTNDDTRNSNARTPTAHSHPESEITNLVTDLGNKVVVAGQIGGTAASPDVRGLRETGGPTLLTLGAVAEGQVLTRSGANLIGTTPGGGSPPAWKGAVIGCWKDGDPHWVIDSMLHNPVHATPTNISITVARCAFFKLDTQLLHRKMRFFGVGATTNVYRFNLYRLSDGAQMIDGAFAFTTAAQAWGGVGNINIGNKTLDPGVIYVIAVAVNAVGTTAGVACHSGTTGRIGIIPTNWPGSLKIDASPAKIDAMGFCQFAVTGGVLPTTLPTLVLQSAWTGGMCALFLDSNNA